MKSNVSNSVTTIFNHNKCFTNFFRNVHTEFFGRVFYFEKVRVCQTKNTAQFNDKTHLADCWITMSKTGKSIGDLVEILEKHNEKLDQLTSEVRGLRKRVSSILEALNSKSSTAPPPLHDETPSSPFATSLRSLISQVSSEIMVLPERSRSPRPHYDAPLTKRQKKDHTSSSA